MLPRLLFRATAMPRYATPMPYFFFAATPLSPPDYALRFAYRFRHCAIICRCRAMIYAAICADA